MASNDMHFEDNRLESFGDEWPLPKRCKCTIKKLVASGFYSIATEEEPDLVCCYMCEKELGGWEKTDEPKNEHKEHSPLCPLVGLHLFDNRVKTFARWPHSDFPYTPADLAKAGFVFAPTSDAPDAVHCFDCGKAVSGWEATDVPLDVHTRRLRRKCTFVRALQERQEQEKAEQTQEEEQVEQDVNQEESTAPEPLPPVQEEEEQTEKQSQPVAKAAHSTRRATRQTRADTSEDKENSMQTEATTTTKKQPKKKATKGKSKSKGRITAASKKALSQRKMNVMDDEREEEGETEVTKTEVTKPTEEEGGPAMVDDMLNETGETIADDSAMLDDSVAGAAEDDMTVEEYLQSVHDTKVHNLVCSCEETIANFLRQAQEARATIEAM